MKKKCVRAGKKPRGKKHKAEEAYEAVDPEVANHVLLILMRKIEDEEHLKPCQIAKLAGITHQHHLKLQPTTEKKETLIKFVTIMNWCNGLKRPLLKLMRRLTKEFRSRGLVHS